MVNGIFRAEYFRPKSPSYLFLLLIEQNHSCVLEKSNYSKNSGQAEQHLQLRNICTDVVQEEIIHTNIGLFFNN